MIWLSHPTGNVFVRALLAAFGKHSIRHEFFTSLGFASSSIVGRALPEPLSSEARRRAYDIHPDQLHARPAKEIGRLLASRFLPALARHESGAFSVDAVFRDLDRSVATKLLGKGRMTRPEAVYCYEDGAEATFAAARRMEVRCCYELPIAYWETSRRLLEEEAARWPEWEPTLVGTRDSAAKMERKTAELEMADAVICPSQFVYRSLPEIVRGEKRCVVAEFGSPEPQSAERNSQPSDQSPPLMGPLRVLFAGSMTQRKGLADLFAAFRRLGRSDIELVVMGTPVAPMDFYRGQYPHFLYEAPRPHAEVIALMRRCNVLVLPSIVEGRALVQQEALSCGLPIIVTANAGGEDLVEEGRTGFLVPIRSPAAIAEKIAWLADHRSMLPEMRAAAVAKARACSWESYGRKIIDALTGLTATCVSH